MKCTTSERHNRFLIVSDLPPKIDGLRNDIESLEIEVRYVNSIYSSGSASKAIVLDHVIVPAILKALNEHEDTSGEAGLTKLREACQDY